MVPHLLLTLPYGWPKFLVVHGRGSVFQAHGGVPPRWTLLAHSTSAYSTLQQLSDEPAPMLGASPVVAQYQKNDMVLV